MANETTSDQDNEAGGQNSGSDRPYHKFLVAEMVIVGGVLLAIDGLAALLDTSGIGYWIASFIQGTATLGITWLVHSKGGRRAWALEKQLKKQIANFLPWVPTTFIIFLIDAYQHNHPKLAKITQKATGSSG